MYEVLFNKIVEFSSSSPKATLWPKEDGGALQGEEGSFLV